MMATEVEPVEGHWYFNRDNGDQFSVLSIDEVEGMVQIQHQNANLDEIPLSSWYSMNIDVGEPVLDRADPLADTDQGLADLATEDPHALQEPDESERYRREHVEYAGKAGKDAPDPRPEYGEDDKYERGSEMGTERWPETRERP
jgi:hypothetical protein